MLDYLLRAESFSCTWLLGRPLWRSRDKLIAIFDQKKIFKNTLDPDPNSLEMLDPVPYPDSMNPDLPLCLFVTITYSSSI
jgi:hypothetical protein